MSDEVRQAIALFIAQNFLYEDDASSVDPAVSLFDTGVVDSTGVLEVVSFLEEEFDISVRDEDLIPENFETVLRLKAYVARRQAESV